MHYGALSRGVLRYLPMYLPVLSRWEGVEGMEDIPSQYLTQEQSIGRYPGRLIWLGTLIFSKWKRVFFVDGVNPRSIYLPYLPYLPVLKNS